LEHYQRFLVGKLLDLPIVREIRGNIAIQTLKAGTPLPLGLWADAHGRVPLTAGFTSI
jgi:Lrp/AsnC family leucine-responsive transcriptional regulator